MIKIERASLLQIWEKQMLEQEFYWENSGGTIFDVPFYIGLSKNRAPSIAFVQGLNSAVIEHQFGCLHLSSFQVPEFRNYLLVLECTDLEYMPLFAVMCSSFLLEYSIKECHLSVEEALHQECKIWEKVFVPEEGNEPIGLLGELYVYKKILESKKYHPIWHYPIKVTKDIELSPTKDLEVKTSGRRRGFLVSIHGLLQLLEHGEKSIDLVFVRVEKVAKNGDISITKLYKQIESCLTNNQRLAIDKLDEDLSSQTYNVIESKVFRVDSSFPRIVPSTLDHVLGKDRISAVQYSIELSDYPSISLDEYIKQAE
ncbi:MAG: PD-(D/E)XK motif protein [Sphaerochaeta sp.]|nr:PD-(D/E)XK motif protein [Sphaerochaeta sp.]